MAARRSPGKRRLVSRAKGSHDAAVFRPRTVALLALLSTLLACSEPGDGSGVGPRDTLDTSDGILFPDLGFDSQPDTDPGPDTADTAPADTLSPDTTPPVDTAPDTTGCVNGAGCDDRDPCTVNDRCQAGTCRGDAIDCNDNNPCTDDTCFGGICQHPLAAAKCLINGVCWSDQQPNPQNPCLRCQSSASTSTWTSSDGLKCDDGDACTEGETCQAGACKGGVIPPEICDNGQDDDCNGQTDLADNTCGGVKLCTYHTDCYPERVCARWETTGVLRCSDPCAGASDCGAGQICSKVPGSAQVGFCQDTPDGLVDGAACTDEIECQSRICSDGRCAPLCLDEAHCDTPGRTCHPVGDLSIGLISAACDPDPAGTRSIGQVCSLDGGLSFDGSVCTSGHCDLLAPVAQTTNCAPLCKTDFDCSPSQECNLVLGTNTERAEAVAYDPLFTQKTRDTLTACYTRSGTGNAATGTQCTQRSQCRSNKCLGLIPNDARTFCTSFCTTDAQCPANMACKLEVLNLASEWLYAAGTQATGAYTFVRVCKFR